MTSSIGYVVSISGSSASVRIPAPLPADSPVDVPDTVGNFLSIETATSTVIGVITAVDISVGDLGGPEEQKIAHVDLLGEIRDTAQGGKAFQRGITKYPRVGDRAAYFANEFVSIVYAASAADTICIGQLQHDKSIGAYINVDEMVNNHFALFGTSGVGKSSGLVVILQEVIKARPDLRIFLIDPHNEYGRCFGDKAQVINRDNLQLPFWLFNFEEIVDVFFRGRPGLDDEVEILAQVIPLAKNMYSSTRALERLSLKGEGSGLTADSPMPYRLSDLTRLIDDRMGKLENRSQAGIYSRLLNRIETVRDDPRYSFMFDDANAAGDNIVDVLCHLFRLPPEGKPMSVMQLAGVPAEVVDSVISVLGRLAFEFGLWSDGAAPLLFVCEEAHRYAPADRAIGFGPTRKAISRIAKEGRKYGVYLGLVTQRPADLDATIISQCSTLFAMRMSNDRDQSIIRYAVSDAAASVLAFVPSLGTQEVFAFGAGVALPTRLRFAALPAAQIPASESASSVIIDAAAGVGPDFVAAVVGRWRGASMAGKKRKLGEPAIRIAN